MSFGENRVGQMSVYGFVSKIFKCFLVQEGFTLQWLEEPLVSGMDFLLLALFLFLMLFLFYPCCYYNLVYIVSFANWLLSIPRIHWLCMSSFGLQKAECQGSCIGLKLSSYSSVLIYKESKEGRRLSLVGQTALKGAHEWSLQEKLLQQLLKH